MSPVLQVFALIVLVGLTTTAALWLGEQPWFATRANRAVRWLAERID